MHIIKNTSPTTAYLTLPTTEVLRLKKRRLCSAVVLRDIGDRRPESRDTPRSSAVLCVSYLRGKAEPQKHGERVPDQDILKYREEYIRPSSIHQEIQFTFTRNTTVHRSVCALPEQREAESPRWRGVNFFRVQNRACSFS